MAIININYDEENKQDLGYKSVEIFSNNSLSIEIFNSGNFIKDWYNCMKFCLMIMSNEEHPIAFSSSVDNFIMDGAPYDSAFLYFINTKASLSYDNNIKGIEVFVPKGTQPIWEELKEMCK